MYYWNQPCKWWRTHSKHVDRGQVFFQRRSQKGFREFRNSGHIWKFSISTYHKVFEALWVFQPLLNINLWQMHSVKNNFKQLLKPINSYNSYCCFHFHKVNTTVHKSHLAKTRFRLSDLEIQYEQHFTRLKQQRRQRENAFQPIVFSELWGRYPARLSHLLQAAQDLSQCPALTLKSADCNTLLQCCHQTQTACLPWDYCFSPDWHILWSKMCNKKRNSNFSRSFFQEQSQLHESLVKQVVHGVRGQNGNGV